MISYVDHRLPRVVEAIHKRQIAEHGGIPGIKDADGLQSALARPRNLFGYSDHGASLPALPAAYTYGIAKVNHPFNDGNKRVALVVSLTFLKLNGFELVAELEDRYDKFEGVAAGRVVLRPRSPRPGTLPERQYRPCCL